MRWTPTDQQVPKRGILVRIHVIDILPKFGRGWLGVLKAFRISVAWGFVFEDFEPLPEVGIASPHPKACEVMITLVLVRI